MNSKEIIYGNIVTMDKDKSRAEAMVINGEKITFVGSKDDAQNLIDSNTEVIDFSGKTIYPGFIDVHSHIGLLSTIMAGGPSFDYGDSYEKNIEELTKYIEENPGKEIYKAYGFTPDSKRGFPTHEMLDNIVIDGKKFDKPIVVMDVNGHLSWLNKAAMDKFSVNKDLVKKFGEDLVLCDDNGEPIGCLKESPHYAVAGSIPVDLDEAKAIFTEIQQDHINHGYSMVGDCGIDEGANPMVTAMGQLAQKGKLKIKVRAYYQIFETCEEPLKEIDKAIKYAKKYNCDAFKIIGFKIFLDGVNGGMSCWTLEPYKNYKFKGQPYSGCKRWNYDRIDELSQIIRKANENGMSVELHAIGSGAARYALDALEKAQAGCANPDFRNAVSHLNCVHQDDVPRFGKLNVTPVTAPHWYTFVPAEIGAEKTIYGDPETNKDLDGNGYEDISSLQSYLDTGATMAFHSDGDPDVEISRILYAAVNKVDLFEDPNMRPRNIKEKMQPYDALKCLTTNSAYVLKEEDTVGSLEAGKQADFIVYDIDFTNEEAMKDPNTCGIAPKHLYISGQKQF